jgi:PST family polysaccharide transporter
VAEPRIEHRAARMTAVATARQILSLPLGLLSAIVVARLYAPGDLGRFAVLSFVVTLPALVGDLGLTQAFVRQRDDPSGEELALAASLQLWIAAVALPVLLVGVRVAEAGSDIAWVALALVLYLPTLAGAVALRANVLVARRLDFARLALLDLIQQLLYIGVLLWLGLRHAGLTGLIVATTLGQLLRLAVLARWYPGAPAALPRIGRLRDVMKSGLPLHLTGIMSGFHAGMLNWLGAPLFGPVAVGYLRWSQDMSTRVGTGLAHAIGSVVYPTIALLQDDVGRLGRVVARAVRYNALLIGVPLALLAGLANPVISAVFGGRWAPAATALQLFCALMVAAAVLVPLDAAVKVVRPTIWSLGIMLAYLGVEVVLALALARPAGFLAIPLAHLAATIGLVILLRTLLPAAARPEWSDNVFLPLLALAAAFGASRWIAVVAAPWPALIAGGAAGALAAAAVAFALGRRTIWPELLRDLRHLSPARPAPSTTAAPL